MVKFLLNMDQIVEVFFCNSSLHNYIQLPHSHSQRMILDEFEAENITKLILLLPHVYLYGKTSDNIAFPKKHGNKQHKHCLAYLFFKSAFSLCHFLKIGRLALSVKTSVQMHETTKCRAR